MTSSAQAGNPATYSNDVDEAAKKAIEMLSWHFGELRRPLVRPDQAEHALARALMLRDSVDMGCRLAASATQFIENTANRLPALTQNGRRKQIVPTIPSVLALKELSFKTVQDLDARCLPWTREDAAKNDFRRALKGRNLDTFMSGRTYLLGINSAQVQFGRLLIEIQKLESRFGSFHIWIKSPQKALISSLQRSIIWRERDAEEFLDEVLRERSGTECYIPETPEEIRRFCALKGSVAGILWNKGKGARQAFNSVEQLLKWAALRDLLRDRIRPIELGGSSVLSVEKMIENASEPADDNALPDRGDFAKELLDAFSPNKADQRYLHLKLVEKLTPREIREELKAQGPPLNDKEFAAVQHRCNALLRRVRVEMKPVSGRPLDHDAIVELLRGIRHHH